MVCERDGSGLGKAESLLVSARMRGDGTHAQPVPFLSQ